jgi:triosephosphate isomerase
MKKKVIIGNLKMNFNSFSERKNYLDELKKEVARNKLSNQVEVVLCPPILHFEFFKTKTPKNIQLGAQDIFWKERGSYTGETSPLALRNFGCEYAICGHSERRKYLRETGQMVGLKVEATLRNDLGAIICVGETQEDRQTGKTVEVIKKQIDDVFLNIEEDKIKKIIIAYEPVWSVGSNVVPTADEIMEMRLLIKKILTQKYSLDAVSDVRIIYGGSVNAQTVKQVCFESGMDGALIGRESLAPEEFFRIIKMFDL